LENSTFQLSDEEKHTILNEEKKRLSRMIARMKSREIEVILHEESPFYRRRDILATALEILIGVYTGIISVTIILFIMKIFS
jgi:hypothetical protein